MIVKIFWLVLKRVNLLKNFGSCLVTLQWQKLYTLRVRAITSILLIFTGIAGCHIRIHGGLSPNLCPPLTILPARCMISKKDPANFGPNFVLLNENILEINSSIMKDCQLLDTCGVVTKTRNIWVRSTYKTEVHVVRFCFEHVNM